MSEFVANLGKNAQLIPMQLISFFQEKSPIVIEKWNAQEVKVTFDDLIVKFMNEELKYQEDSFLLKLKVGVYFVLNVIGACTGAYAHFVKPFASTKLLTFVGSSVYLLGLGLFTLLMQFNYIRPTIYRGSGKSGKVWMESTLLYPQGVYSLQVKRFNAPEKTFSLAIPVGEWITEAGEIVPEAV